MYRLGTVYAGSHQPLKIKSRDLGSGMKFASVTAPNSMSPKMLNLGGLSLPPPNPDLAGKLEACMKGVHHRILPGLYSVQNWIVELGTSCSAYQSMATS